jgi:alpha-glucosidase (family GH31 glycosyl hydrolase)
MQVFENLHMTVNGISHDDMMSFYLYKYAKNYVAFFKKTFSTKETFLMGVAQIKRSQNNGE